MDAGEHAKRQDIDLHDAQGVDIVFVPFDEAAAGRGGGADGDGFVEPAFGEDEAADMLGEVAGEADELAGEGDGAADGRAFRIQANFADAVVWPEGLAGVPAFGGEGGCYVL